MPTRDALRCGYSGCGKPAEYRVITLQDDGIVKGEKFVASTGLILSCSRCLVDECAVEPIANRYPVMFTRDDGEQVEEPPEIAVLILPMKLTKSQVAALREEITESLPLDKPV